jgi:4-hydroxy-tetrahydrodipicolinate reductase
MGQALLRLAPTTPGLRLVGAVGGRAAPAGLSPAVAALAAGQLGQAPEADVLVDFSLPAGFDAVVAFCASRGLPLVSGTTGLDAAQREAMARLAQEVPVLWAANFSLGVAVLEDLVRRAATALPHWQAHVLETHHLHKKDAPSGTALHLGRALAESAGHEPEYLSLRAGDVVGEHLVQFTGMGERLELVHRASDRDVFARGALECALRLVKRRPGLYRVGDLLGTGA